MFKKIKQFLYAKQVQYHVKCLKKADAKIRKLYEGYGLMVDAKTADYLIKSRNESRYNQ